MENFINHLKSSPETANQFIVGVMKQNFSNDQYWHEVCPLFDFSNSKVENWVLENLDLFNLDCLTMYAHNISPKIIDLILDSDNIKLVNLDNLLKYQHLSTQQIDLYIHLVDLTQINWTLLQEYQTLTPNFIAKYVQYLDWELISENQFMDLKFLLLNKSKISWHLIPLNHHLQPIINSSFLKLFADTNIWEGIGWLDNDLVTTDMLINEFGTYLTPKALRSIQMREKRLIF